jgi:protein-S-isoprenylcysteine O-methyltransferase Ste14
MNRVRAALTALLGTLLLVAGYGLGLTAARNAAVQTAGPWPVQRPEWVGAIQGLIDGAMWVGVVVAVFAGVVVLYLEVRGDE